MLVTYKGLKSVRMAEHKFVLLDVSDFSIFRYALLVASIIIFYGLHKGKFTAGR